MESKAIDNAAIDNLKLFHSILKEERQQEIDLPIIEADPQKFFLTTLQKHKTQISIFLSNGIRLKGHIGSFNETVIILFGDTIQMIYKHAVATILLG